MGRPRPTRVAEIPTPALVVDVAAMERNIRRMADFFQDGPCRLRPHFKAHKTPEIARRQLAAGACSGLTCATVSEAEAVADLCDDLLIANEPIGPGKCERVAALARHLRMTVAVPVFFQSAHAVRGARAEAQLQHDLGAAIAAHLHQTCSRARPHPRERGNALGALEPGSVLPVAISRSVPLAVHARLREQKAFDL